LKSCRPSHGISLRDVHWRHGQSPHPLVGQVLKGASPIATAGDACARTPLEQLIADVWEVIREGGIVLLGEVHDNPEHHAVRGDILQPRLEQTAPARGVRPAAVFEHIRTSQQAQLESFYAKSAKSRRLWRASDLLRELAWNKSGWPPAEIFYPLFDAALWARQPIHAGSADRDRVRTLVRGDAPEPTDAEARRLALARSMPQPLVAALTTELAGSHCGIVEGPALDRMGLAQRYTDAHLAEAVVRAAERHGGAFLLAGNGHVRADRGVPWHLRRLAPARKAVAVMLLEVAEGRNDPSAYLPRTPGGAVAADYVLFTPRHPRPDPCERLRRGNPAAAN
jgi:uncharacterized iron-regulated protein